MKPLIPDNNPLARTLRLSLMLVGEDMKMSFGIWISSPKEVRMNPSPSQLTPMIMSPRSLMSFAPAP